MQLIKTTAAERKGVLGLPVRVSDTNGREKNGGEEGKKNDSFISPDEQIRDAARYVSAQGWDVLVLDPQDLNVPYSTAIAERKALPLGLRMIAAGDLDGLVFSSQDRIGTPDVMRELKARLFELRAVLKVADNPAAENLGAKGYARLPGDMMTEFHGAHREEMGLRFTKARRNAVERGVHGRAPFGYRKVERKVNEPALPLMVVAGEAAVVKDCFESRARGESYGEIAKRHDLHDWDVRRIVRNDTYLGIARSGDFENEHAHTALVSRDVFEKANARRTSKPKPSGETTREMLALGCVYCTGCGHTLKVTRRPNPRGGEYPPVFYCRDSKCKARGFVHCDRLDAYVADLVERSLEQDAHWLSVVATQRDLELAQAERDEAKLELDEFVVNASVRDKALWQKGLRARELRFEQAEERVRELAAKVAALPVGGSLRLLWDSVDIEERRRFLRALLRVEVAKGAASDFAGHVQVFSVADGSRVDDDAGAGMLAA